MDERDVRLLKAISESESGSPERLHEETDIPVSTIHYRLNNLRDAGVIENDLYDVDLEALGLDTTAVVEVSADCEGNHRAVGDEIRDVEGVTRALFTTGETDFTVMARLPGLDHVERLVSAIESIDAVERTDSRVVMDAVCDVSRPLQSYPTERLVEELVDAD